MSEQILSKRPTELQYVERSVFMKEVITQNLRSFELGTDINVPMWINIGFQQRYRQDSQSLNNDTFYKSSVTSAQCVASTNKYPASGMLLCFDDDEYSQVFKQIEEAFKALTKMISFKHIYLIMSLDHLMLLILVIFNTSSK